MGLRTLVLAFVLLALLAYVSSAPFPSDSSESKSRDVSESHESGSLHSDESASASDEKYVDHRPTGHKNKRDVTSQTAAPTTVAAHTGVHSSASSITTTALPSSTAAATEGKLELDVQEFYPVQSLFP